MEKITLKGDCFVALAGVEHRSVAESEVHITPIEPVSSVNTGNAGGERTVENPERI